MKKILLALSLLILASCSKLIDGNIDPYLRDFFIYAKYTNTNGNNPVLEIDFNKTSDALKTSLKESEPTTSTNDLLNRVYLTFNDIRIQDELGNWAVESQEGISESSYDDTIVYNVETSELRNNVWEDDPENKLVIQTNQELDVVLVLDVSSSLGTDVENVKGYARDFTETVYNNPNARIGIVGFSDNIQTLPLTTDKQLVLDFIDNLEGSDATKLYQAMMTGLGLFNGINSLDASKAMVTFTDGQDNYNSFDNGTFFNELLDSITVTGINSYTIGLTGKGGVDEDQLQQLAIGGSYSFPQYSSELDYVFDKIANTVISTYSFAYNRNDAKISSPVQLRFRIKSKLL